MTPDDLGIRIRRARERLDMSQAQLAAAVNRSVRAVGSWERGETVPRNAIGALERVLGVDLTGQPDAIEPRDGFEAELLSLTHLPPGEAERLIEMYRARGAEPPRRTG